MANDWMIDVLADLKAVARRNGMEATAASLEDASLVALTEIGSLQVANRNTKSMAVQAEVECGDNKVTPLFSKHSYA